MSWIARTLWDLIAPPRGRGRPARPEEPVATSASRRTRGRRPTMRERYDDLVVEMKRTYGVRVRKWRTHSSGCAWEVHYHDGSTVRLIEAPRPRGPMSCAIFLHEIGHHAIGFGRHRPRCLEEYHAWRWALQAMRDRGFNVTPAVERRMAEALRYAVEKARRRGLREVPRELAPFLADAPAPTVLQ
jgi:hypothetical protein